MSKIFAIIALLGLTQGVKLEREISTFSAAKSNHDFDLNNFMSSTEQEDFKNEIDQAKKNSAKYQAQIAAQEAQVANAAETVQF